MSLDALSVRGPDTILSFVERRNIYFFLLYLL